MKPKVSESRVIEGVLVPVSWSSSGEVSEVGLMAFDEAEYKLDAAAVAQHGLRDHLRKRARVTITEGIRGQRVVVIRVEILDDDAPPSPRRNKDAEES